jgi:hypothetical protein
LYLKPKGISIKKADRDRASIIAMLTASYEDKPFNPSDQQPRIYDPYHGDEETLAYIDRYFTIAYIAVDVKKALALYKKGGNMCQAITGDIIRRLELKVTRTV